MPWGTSLEGHTLLLILMASVIQYICRVAGRVQREQGCIGDAPCNTYNLGTGLVLLDVFCEGSLALGPSRIRDGSDITIDMPSL